MTPAARYFAAAILLAHNPRSHTARAALQTALDTGTRREIRAAVNALADANERLPAGTTTDDAGEPIRYPDLLAGYAAVEAVGLDAPERERATWEAWERVYGR